MKGLISLTTPFPWARYSKKLSSKILNPKNGGFFTPLESEERGMRLALGVEGSVEEGNLIQLYWLVDKEDGIIVDVKFQVFGQSALIGAAEVAAELLIGKNYDQAKRVTADLLESQVRDRPEEEAFPKETYLHLNLVIGAIENAAEKCTDIPFASNYKAPPAPAIDSHHEGYPGWLDLPLKQKIAVIEEVLDRDVRPYIALDAGGVEVVNLIEDKQVVISYQGSCTSCYSSVGTTLSYIQQTLRSKVHPSLTVTPNIDLFG